MGQQLRNMLTENLAPRGRSARTDYRLVVTLTETKKKLAIKKDETATRANLTIRAKFKLHALSNPNLGTFAGRALSTNSYNILTSDFATLSAERDARNRALRTLAEEIRLRVASALRNQRAFSAPPVDRIQP
jgi:LPS-assembly lipoprotein